MICPICQKNTNLVLRLDDFPLHLPPTKEKKLDLETLKIYKCKKCDFLFNESKDNQFYENLYKNQISYVKPKVKSNWTQLIINGGYQNILEIGGGANPVANNLPSYIKTTVVDPFISDSLEIFSNMKLFEGNLEQFLESLKKNNYDKNFDAIFMSHTLEHIADVNSLIKILASEKYFRNADLLIELPNIYNYSVNCSFYTFFFEHCSLFTPKSLNILLRRYLYNIELFKYADNEDQDLMFIFKPKKFLNNNDNVFDDQSQLIVDAFKFNIERIKKSFIERIEKINSEKIVINNSGGGSTSLFLYYLNRDRPDIIKKLYLVDNKLSGYYTSSTGKFINKKEDLDLPVIEII